MVEADNTHYVKYVPLLLVGAALDPTARGMAPGPLHSGPLRLQRLGELLPSSGPRLAWVALPERHAGMHPSSCLLADLRGMIRGAWWWWFMSVSLREGEAILGG